MIAELTFLFSFFAYHSIERITNMAILVGLVSYSMVLVNNITFLYIISFITFNGPQ
jgi:hypothetical protein